MRTCIRDLIIVKLWSVCNLWCAKHSHTYTHTNCGNYRHFDFRARFATSILSTQQVHTQPATDNLWNAHFCLPARVVLSNSILTLAVQLLESISIPHFLRRLNLLFGSINATRNLICRNEYLWMCNSGHSKIGLPACAHTECDRNSFQCIHGISFYNSWWMRKEAKNKSETHTNLMRCTQKNGKITAHRRGEGKRKSFVESLTWPLVSLQSILTFCNNNQCADIIWCIIWIYILYA